MNVHAQELQPAELHVQGGEAELYEFSHRFDLIREIRLLSGPFLSVWKDRRCRSAPRRGLGSQGRWQNDDSCWWTGFSTIRHRCSSTRGIPTTHRLERPLIWPVQTSDTGNGFSALTNPPGRRPAPGLSWRHSVPSTKQCFKKHGVPNGGRLRE